MSHMLGIGIGERRVERRVNGDRKEKVAVHPIVMQQVQCTVYAAYLRVRSTQQQTVEFRRIPPYFFHPVESCRTSWSIISDTNKVITVLKSCSVRSSIRHIVTQWLELQY
jgi:hypothetical protein